MSTPEQSIADTRRGLRQKMPVADRWAYFDHAAVAPISGPAAKALGDWLEQATLAGTTEWPGWSHSLQATRIEAARLIGADIDEIALVPNTTSGIHLVADGLDWQPGDNVVILEDEFPSNLYPWMNLARLGVETRRFKVRGCSEGEGLVHLDRLADMCDSRTRVISVSWIGYANGCRRDLAAIGHVAHEAGALFFVDAIQGIGAFPIDVDAMHIDFLAADGHKWQLGPEGAGIAYLRSDHLESLRPMGVGWHSVVHAHNFDLIELDLKKSAARYEGGSHNMAGFLALGASLKLLGSLGIENIAASILDFTDLACAEIEKVGATILSPRKRPDRSYGNTDPRSGIVVFDLPGCDPMEVRKYCLQQSVVLSCRGGHLRISPHAYNNEQDLEQLIDALEAC
jgi:selenocysteine lyase/cysteine desulfurase